MGVLTRGAPAGAGVGTDVDKPATAILARPDRHLQDGQLSYAGRLAARTLIVFAVRVDNDYFESVPAIGTQEIEYS
jgi:hypothetical protein